MLEVLTFVWLKFWSVVRSSTSPPTPPIQWTRLSCLLLSRPWADRASRTTHFDFTVNLRPGLETAELKEGGRPSLVSRSHPEAAYQALPWRKARRPELRTQPHTLLPTSYRRYPGSSGNCNTHLVLRHALARFRPYVDHTPATLPESRLPALLPSACMHTDQT